MTDHTHDKSSPGMLSDGSRQSGVQSWLHGLRAKLGFAVPQSVRDALEGALKTDASTSFTDTERKMLERLLRFGSSRVVELMVPRAEITALDENESIAELLATFEEAGVSRIPLFRETLDDPRGMIHIKDLFRWFMAEAASRPLRSGKSEAAEDIPDPAKIVLQNIDLNRPITTVKIRRQILYVPPSMPAVDLLIRMQSTRIHMALVVDEYGGTDGLVTIEDLVEQVVGNIEDEHDDDEEINIVSDPKLGVVAAGRTEIEELEKHLGLKLTPEDEESDVDTLGGLIFSMLGRVPARGELIQHPAGIEFEILDADPRRVKKVKIHPVRTAPQSTKMSAEAPKA
jgi:CBS domain containing-hemolysin-like protein